MVSKPKFSQSVSESARAVLSTTIARFIEVKTKPPKWAKNRLRILLKGAEPRGRPKGTGLDDERYCVEMAKLILQGKTRSRSTAARLVSAEESPYLRDTAIDRRRKKYKRNESDYVAQAKRELDLDIN